MLSMIAKNGMPMIEPADGSVSGIAFGRDDQRRSMRTIKVPALIYPSRVVIKALNQSLTR